MRPRRSDSSATTSTSGSPQKSRTRHASPPELAPNLDAESEEMEVETSRTPEENKNPEKSSSKISIRVEKSLSFTPPPALSPAHSLQGQVEEDEEGEEGEVVEVKMETDSSIDQSSPEKTPKKVEKKEGEEKKPEVPRQKMKYKKREEKDKNVVPMIDPNGPKRNRSAYVHFIIHRRASYSKTVMSQRDINISLAADWQKLTAEERIPFHKLAEEEKEKYLELMEEYKKTDSHKEFLKARSKYLTSQSSSSHKSHHRKRKPGEDSDDDDDPMIQMTFPKTNVFCPLLNNSNATSTSSNSLQYAGPIFTPEFMSYNKTRDSYRRQLAAERSNVEHELEALHQFDMDVRIQKQGERLRGVDEKIEETMSKMRAVFGGVSAAKDHLSSIDSLNTWLQSVTRLAQTNHTKKSVKEAINKNGKAIVAIRK